jgi:hypothetical protein
MTWMAVGAAVFVVASAMPIVRWLSRSRVESPALSRAWVHAQRQVSEQISESVRG